MIRLFTIIL